VRAKYKELLGCFLQMKAILDGVSQEAWIGEEVKIGRELAMKREVDGIEIGPW